MGKEDYLLENMATMHKNQGFRMCISLLKRENNLLNHTSSKKKTIKRNVQLNIHFFATWQKKKTLKHQDPKGIQHLYKSANLCN